MRHTAELLISDRVGEKMRRSFFILRKTLHFIILLILPSYELGVFFNGARGRTKAGTSFHTAAAASRYE
ncbi:hypothetical protein BJX96DRAFT_152759 [Aspergillus floccosus]